jgi:hypothetical protein
LHSFPFAFDQPITLAPSKCLLLKYRIFIQLPKIKTVGGLRRTRYRGLERTQAWGYFVAGTYNLLRLARLESTTAS